MYTNDEIERWVLGIPFEDNRSSGLSRPRPYTTLLGKTHFVREVREASRITRRDRTEKSKRAVGL